MPAKKITIELEAGTASFLTGMNKGEGALDRFGHKAHEGRGFLDKFKEGFAIGAGIETFRASLEALEAPFERLHEAFEQVASIGRDALKLGVSAEDMSRFQHAANATGVDVTSLTTGIGKLSEEIGKVASGDAGAKVAADALAHLGLNAKQLTAQDPAATFRQVSAAIAGMHDPYARAAAVQDLMGRGGRELIPVMEHLQELMQESDDIGFTRTPEQIKAAEEEEHKLAAAVDGLKAKLMDLATSDWSMKLVEGFKHAAEGATWFIDQLSDKQGQTIDQLQGRRQNLFEQAIPDISDDNGNLENVKHRLELAQQLLKLDEQIGAAEDDPRVREANISTLKADQERIDPLSKQLKLLEDQKKSADDLAASSKAAAEASQQAADAEQKQWESVQKKVEEIEKSARQAGMTKDQKEIDDLSRAGADDQQIKDAENAQRTRAAIDDQNKLAEKAKRMWEEARTPAQKYNEEVTALDKAMKAHLLTEDQYLEAAKHAGDAYEKAKDKGIPDLTPDKEDRDRDRQASLVSRQFDFRIGGQSQADTQQKELVNTTKRQLDLQQNWDKTFTALFNWLQGAGIVDNVLDLS